MQMEVLCFKMRGLFGFLKDFLLHGFERVHQFLYLSFAVQFFVVFSSEEFDGPSKILDHVSGLVENYYLVF